VIKVVRPDSHPLIQNGQLLSKVLRDYRIKHKLSQKAVATKVGVGVSTITNWERGRTKPARTLLPNLKFLL